MFKLPVVIKLIALLFIPAKISAQFTNNQVDSLINVAAAQLRLDGNWKAAVPLYKEILSAAQNNNYKKGIADSYINIANLYFLQGNSTVSIQYLDSAITALDGFNDKQLELRILIEQARNYFKVGWKSKAVTHFDKALELAGNLKNEEIRQKQIQYIYSIKATMYEESNEIPNYYDAIEKSYQIYPSPFVAARMTRYFLLYNKNLDSARNYIEIANKLWETGSFPVHQKSIMLRNEGLYHFVIQNYHKAKDLYEQSITISKKLGNKIEEKKTLEMLAEVHGKMKNTAGKDSALQHSLLLDDSLKNDIANAVASSTADSMEQGQKLTMQKKSRSEVKWWFVAALFFITLAVIAIFLKKQE